MITVLLGIEQNGEVLRRFLVTVENNGEEINHEAVIDELRMLLNKWAQSWLRIPGTKVSITVTGRD